MAHDTPPSRRHRLALCTLGAAALAATLAAPIALAKSPAEELIATLNVLIASVNDLSTKVNQLIASHGTASGTVLSTSTVMVSATQIAHCNVTNLATTTVAVMVFFKNSAGGDLYAPKNLSIAPGASLADGFGPPFGQPFRCEFRADATASSLRANMTVSEGGPTAAPLLVLEAR